MYNTRIKIYRDGSQVIRAYYDTLGLSTNSYDDYYEELASQFFYESFMKYNNKSVLNFDDVQHIEFDDIPKSYNELEENQAKQQLKLKQDIYRTRNKLIDYAINNKDKFHTFITLTFKDIVDVNEGNKKFHNFITQWKKDKNKQGQEFYYLGVPEYQKRGSIHYHILTSLINDIDIEKKEKITTFNYDKKKKYDIEFYDIKHWKHGFSTSYNLDHTDNNFDVSLYISKYLTKDIDDRLYLHKKILKSNNLEYPAIEKIYMPNIDVFESLYGKPTYIFDKKYEYCSNFKEWVLKKNVI